MSRMYVRLRQDGTDFWSDAAIHGLIGQDRIAVLTEPGDWTSMVTRVSVTSAFREVGGDAVLGLDVPFVAETAVKRALRPTPDVTVPYVGIGFRCEESLHVDGLRYFLKVRLHEIARATPGPVARGEMAVDPDALRAAVVGGTILSGSLRAGGTTISPHGIEWADGWHYPVGGPTHNSRLTGPLDDCSLCHPTPDPLPTPEETPDVPESLTFYEEGERFGTLAKDGHARAYTIREGQPVPDVPEEGAGGVLDAVLGFVETLGTISTAAATKDSLLADLKGIWREATDQVRNGDEPGDAADAETPVTLTAETRDMLLTTIASEAPTLGTAERVLAAIEPIVVSIDANARGYVRQHVKREIAASIRARCDHALRTPCGPCRDAAAVAAAF